MCNSLRRDIGLKMPENSIFSAKMACKTCRFAIRNGTYCTAERPVLLPETVFVAVLHGKFTCGLCLSVRCNFYFTEK